MKLTRRTVRRTARHHLNRGLSHQQVFETLARELGFGGTADRHTLNKLAGWLEQLPGIAALKKERGRRWLLVVLLVFLSLSEAWGAMPVITMLGLNELPGRFFFPIVLVMFIYPLIYLILAVLSFGRSMPLYRWIMVIMGLALLKDIPAFSLYFNAERWLFGLIVAIKATALLLAWIIYRGLRNGISIEVESAPGQEANLPGGDDRQGTEANTGSGL